jgi:GT2 family glycosyltransferase
VPAHNEQAGISQTIQSLLATTYPPERRRIVVVADNCNDGTADAAKAAGAEVIVRRDSLRRGKGHALALAFATVLEDPAVDIVMVVDADTIVTSNLLGAVAASVARGADAVQARYGVRNPEDSWRTNLMQLALACFHDVRALARERFALSTGLHGNGMAFTRRALELVPYEAFSLTEDVEYGIALVRAGIRVWYVDGAAALANMPQSAAQAKSQRERWEGGRLQLRREAWRLACEAVRGRDRLRADAAAELFVPPLAELAACVGAGVVVSTLAARTTGAPLASQWIWGSGLLALGCYAARGWQFSGTGWRGISSLARSPGYLVWKLAVRPRGKGVGAEWRRTARVGE